MRRARLLLLLSIALVAAAGSWAEAAVLVIIDKASQRMTVDVDGTPRWTWPVSTGLRSYETPSGSYKAFRMEKEHFSREWDDAPMPHSIFFTRKGHAIHGSFHTRRLGRRASHGCVRLSPANAAKLYALVEQRGVTNTTVVVTDGKPKRR
jgi:lipoprotein-anchoring transpeptidase ErfK/SrfK